MWRNQIPGYLWQSPLDALQCLFHQGGVLQEEEWPEESPYSQFLINRENKTDHFFGCSLPSDFYKINLNSLSLSQYRQHLHTCIHLYCSMMRSVNILSQKYTQAVLLYNFNCPIKTWNLNWLQTNSFGINIYYNLLWDLCLSNKTYHIVCLNH